MTAVKRAGLYLRVSSPDQRDRDTIESQDRVLRDLAARRGSRIVDVFKDDGFTAKAGKLDKREDLARLFAAVALGQLDEVLVYDIDRLTRTKDIRERGVVIGAFQAAGVVLVTPTTVYDLNTPTGDLMAGIAGWKAAEDNRIRAERVRDGGITSTLRGRKARGPTLYGYHWTGGKDAVWSIDETRGPVVREIVRRVASGESCHAIACDLDARGVTTRPSYSDDRTKPPREGYRWSREKVWRIARSTAYLGQWRADRQRGHLVTVPALVTAEEHAAAQAALVAHGKRGLRRTSHVYLLEGLAVCGDCAARIGIAAGTTGDPRRGPTPARYVCGYRRRPPTPADRCGLAYHVTADLDAAVWDAVADVIASPALVEKALRRLRDREADPVDHAAATVRARSEVARLDRAQAAILARSIEGAISDATRDDSIARLAAARTAAQAALQAAESASAGQAARSRFALAATAGLAQAFDALAAELDGLDAAGRRGWVRKVVSRVVVGHRSAWVELALRADVLATDGGTACNSSLPGLSLGTVRVALPDRHRRAA